MTEKLRSMQKTKKKQWWNSPCSLAYLGRILWGREEDCVQRSKKKSKVYSLQYPILHAVAYTYRGLLTVSE